MISCCEHAPHDFRKMAAPRAPTWRTPLQKAAGDQEYQWLHDIADNAAPEVYRRFMRAISRIRGSVAEKQLQDALAAGDREAALRALGLDEDIDAVLAAQLVPSLHETAAEAGSAAADATPPIAARGGSLALRFNIVNPHTVRAARDYGASLIQQVGDVTRAGIRQIVGDAMEFGGHPYEQARQIRNLVGLTDRQANAVANFRQMLESRDRGALNRALRDKRFDGTLRRALGANPTAELDQPQIDTMVQRYADRMLAARAKNIARTETINAARLGTQQAWEQAATAGLLNRDAVHQGWLVTPDDRTCFPARTPVMTMDGWKPISTVQAGEMVLTHEDRFRRVEAVTGRWHVGPMVKIEFGGRARVKASCTADHKLLTKRGWIEAQEITLEDEVRVLARPCIGCGDLIPHGPGARASRCPKCVRAENNQTRWARPGERERRSADNHRRWADPKEREKASALASGRKASPETKARISDSVRARMNDPVAYKKRCEINRLTAQRPDHSLRNMSPEQRTSAIKKAMVARAKKSRGMSYLERKVRWFLENQGIEFEAQWYFTYGNEGRRGWADFYLPGPNIVVECDGPLHLAPEVASRDAAKDAALKERGIDVLRFSDIQIRAEFPTVADAITARCCFMWLKPKKIRHYSINRQPVYDITIAEDHSFVAGGIVAHNCWACASVPLLNPRGVPLGGEFLTPFGPMSGPALHPQCRCALYLMAF